MRSPLLTATRALLVLAVVTASSLARADEREQCADAAEKGQTLRDEQADHLGARALFVACARASCPTTVRQSCTRWLEELEPRIPTVVVSLRDAAGRDVLGARLVVDGKERGTPLDGTAVAVNPGERSLTVITPSGKQIHEKILAHEGEKGRRVDLREPGPAGGAPAATGDVPGASSQGGVPWWPAIALAGVSVVGFVGYGVLDASARDEYRTLEGACSPTCTDDQLASVRSKVTLSDVGLGIGIGGAALAAGWTLLYFVLRPSTSGSAASRAAYPGALLRF